MVGNVLLLTVDSLRYDALATNGGPVATKALSGASINGISFDRAFATGPGTSPSFPALLTGTLPLSYDGLGPLIDERPRLSEHLRSSGLRTGGFHSNPFLSTHFNYDRGFDTFEDYQNPLMGVATKLFPRGIEVSNPKLRRVDEVFRITDAIKAAYRTVSGKSRPYVNAEVITDDTISWLSETTEPFFCWTHYMDIHHPCHPPKTYREQYDVGDIDNELSAAIYSKSLDSPKSLTSEEQRIHRRLYQAAIEYTDDQLSRIIGWMKENGILEDTLVVITSDHGHLFGEHGKYGKPERMFDELVHVPLVVANGPAYLEKARGNLISLLDIPPIIHDTLGLDVPSEYQGRLPEKDEPRNHVVMEHEVEGDVVIGARTDTQAFEIDKRADTATVRDVDNGDIETISEIENSGINPREVVHERLQSLEIEASNVDGTVDGEIKSRLEELGYLQ